MHKVSFVRAVNLSMTLYWALNIRAFRPDNDRLAVAAFGGRVLPAYASRKSSHLTRSKHAQYGGPIVWPIVWLLVTTTTTNLRVEVMHIQEKEDRLE